MRISSQCCWTSHPSPASAEGKFWGIISDNSGWSLSSTRRLTALLTGPNINASSFKFTAVKQFKINYIWWVKTDWNGSSERGQEKRNDEWRDTKCERFKYSLSLHLVKKKRIRRKSGPIAAVRAGDAKRFACFPSVCLSICLHVYPYIWLSLCPSLFVSV